MTPFASTRALGTLRNGILTQQQRWKHYLQADLALLTEGYLQPLYPLSEGPFIVINSAWVANRASADAVQSLKPGQVLRQGDQWLAGVPKPSTAFFYGEPPVIWATEVIQYTGAVQWLDRPWQLYLQAKQTVEADFDALTGGRKSTPISDPHTAVYNPGRIFIEEGASVKAALLSAENGCIYIGKNAVIEEGALVRGTTAICEGATVNMGAKLRGDNIIGPSCKVGGELANSVLMGFSNKGHDGYMGNSVVGEWCNLGADTNTSNLKNNYHNVELNLGPGKERVKTGQLFCGLLMGDHSKSGINSMFNTGTVVEAGSSLFSGKYLPKYMPLFSWGGEGDEPQLHEIDKMLDTERRVMARRGKELSPAYENVLRHLYAEVKNGR
jgi:UDP-N-acetylglucosamine diphosphorylase/glucosamine-1-phosphate N-acetyltransferase